MTGLLPIADVEFTQGGTIGREAVGQDFISATLPPQGFLQEFQRGLFVARFRHEALEHFTFVADGASEVVVFSVDLHKDLVQVAAPVAQRRPATRRLRISDANSGPNMIHQNRTVS